MLYLIGGGFAGDVCASCYRFRVRVRYPKQQKQQYDEACGTRARVAMLLFWFFSGRTLSEQTERGQRCMQRNGAIRQIREGTRTRAAENLPTRSTRARACKARQERLSAARCSPPHRYIKRLSSRSSASRATASSTASSPATVSACKLRGSLRRAAARMRATEARAADSVSRVTPCKLPIHHRCVMRVMAARRPARSSAEDALTKRFRLKKAGRDTCRWYRRLERMKRRAQPERMHAASLHCRASRSPWYSDLAWRHRRALCMQQHESTTCCLRRVASSTQESTRSDSQSGPPSSSQMVHLTIL